MVRAEPKARKGCRDWLDRKAQRDLGVRRGSKESRVCKAYQEFKVFRVLRDLKEKPGLPEHRG